MLEFQRKTKIKAKYDKNDKVSLSEFPGDQVNEKEA